MNRVIISIIFLSIVLLIMPAAAFSLSLPQGTILAAAASADITPKVAKFEDRNGNGRFDLGDANQAYGFGDRVIAFEEGEIRIGNGRGAAKFIYEPIYARVLVVEDPSTGFRLALVSLDIYMILRQDVQAIRNMLDPDWHIGSLIVAATHSHMAPDTLGLTGVQGLSVSQILKILMKTGKAPSGINPIWFERMQVTVKELIGQCVANLQPATIRLAQTRFNFGIHDTREPLIIDDQVSALALDTPDGRPIATLVQWACHPEAPLIYGSSENQFRKPSDFSEKELEGWGMTISPGFPGYMCKELEAKRGGVSIYFNGPLGGLLCNLNVPVWDTSAHPEYPASLPYDQVPQRFRIANDFRVEPIQGKELANEVLKALSQSSETSLSSTVTGKSNEFLIPLNNPTFRLAAAVGLLGHGKRDFFGSNGKIDRHTDSWLSGVFLPGVKVPTGEYLKSEVNIAQIGDAFFVIIPGEALSEEIIGFPPDFNTAVSKYFPHEAQNHPTGKYYKLAFDPIQKTAKSKYLFVLCLANDELGYIIPASDFRPPHDLPIPPLLTWWISLNAANDAHYEESMAASRKNEPAIMKALTELLKNK